MATSISNRARRLRGKGYEGRAGILEESERSRGRADERGREAGETRSRTLSEIESFDPTEYARGVGRSIYADVSDARNTAQAGRHASLNRRGMFNSNLGGAREGRHFQNQFARALAGLGMQSAGLEGQNIDRLQRQHGMDASREQSERSRSATLLGSEADYERQARLQKKQREGSGNWFSDALGFGAGAIFGPAAGKLGGKLGERVSGWF